MRALAAVCLLVSLAASALAATVVEAAQTNAVRIVTDGKSDWRIVSPSAKAPGVDWAAKELQKYLRQMTGCALPIGGREGSKPAFVIGLRDKLAPADRALLPPPAPRQDQMVAPVLVGRGHILGGQSKRGEAFGSESAELGHPVAVTGEAVDADHLPQHLQGRGH